MAWADVSRRLEKTAPGFASLLQDPTTCEITGAIAAATCECWNDPSAEAVLKALKQRPELAERIAGLDVDNIRYQLAVRHRETAMAAQTEIAINGLFRNEWRAGVGWTLCGMLALMSLSICITVVRDPSRIQDCVEIMTWLVFSASGILGINLHGNSVERRAMMDDTHFRMKQPMGEAPSRPRDLDA